MNLFTKRIFVLALLMVSGIFAFAQDFDSNRGELSDSYQRNSISKMYIAYGDRFDNMVNEYINKIDFGDKYDKNEIGVTSMRSDKKRGEVGSFAVVNGLNQQGIGKQILNYWFKPDKDGKLSYELVQQRSLYNVTDKEVMIQEASKNVQLADMGEKLINNSYVVVFDLKKLEKKETKDKKTGKVTVTYAADMAAYVYQLDFTQDMLTDLFDHMWIQDEDNAATKAAKKKAYNEFQVPMKTTSATTSHGSGKTEQAAIDDTFKRILHNLEKNIDAWQVKTDIVTTHPITAKIGKKENLKNGDRYKVFAYTEADAKTAQGNDTTVLRKVRYGFVRATSIADNRKIADGKMPTSRFFQVHGRHLEEGMLLQEAKDFKVGVSLGVRPIGGVSTVYADIDYLAHINNWGMCLYGMAYVGFDAGTIPTDLGNTDYENQIDYKPYLKKGDTGMFMSLGLGAGYGIPLTRLFELQPYFKVGMDAVGSPKEEELYDKEKDKGQFSTFFGEGGLKFSVQPIHCVRIFIQADYSKAFAEGKYYPEIKNRYGLGLGLGARYSF